MQRYSGFQWVKSFFIRRVAALSNKDLLIDFLNQLLAEKEGKIVDLQYIPTEQLGRNYDDRRAIFDIYCKNEAGERFIVELQKSSQTYFKDRSIYYSTFPIQAQAQISIAKWPQLKAVYTIAILDFTFKDTKKDKENFHHKVKLHNTETKEVFYEKRVHPEHFIELRNETGDSTVSTRFTKQSIHRRTSKCVKTALQENRSNGSAIDGRSRRLMEYSGLIYLELPKFTKTLKECETRFEKWLYVLRNLGDLTKRPAKLKEKIFDKLFEVAEIANYDEVEYADYQSSLRNYRDTNNQLNTKLEEGKSIRSMEIAREMLRDSVNLTAISKYTGLTIKEIESSMNSKEEP